MKSIGLVVRSVGSERKSENFYEKSLLLQKSRDSIIVSSTLICRLQKIVVEDGVAAVYH